MDSKYSLSNLRDIAIPEPPPLWPPAPGTIILLVFVFLAVCYAALLCYRHWKQNAYRRAGLLLLQDAVTKHDMAITLKRVAMAAFSREEVASLYGEEWIAFLNNSCNRCNFSPSFISGEEKRASRDERDIAALWIKHHISHQPGAG
ncbi:MAG: DUF4381 domain-containing protein [Thermodesulfobacteriota bacterium]